MRTRTAALSLAAALALSPALVACSDDTPDTTVGEDGVIETPTGEPNGGNGLNAPSGEPLVPDSSAEPGAGVTATPSSQPVRAASEHAKAACSVAATRADALDGEQLPAGEVHGWWHGQDETACGLRVDRSALVRFPALRWSDVQPDSGGAADLVTAVCARCTAVLRPRGAAGWVRTRPRP